MIIDLINTNMSLSEALFMASDNDIIYLDNKIYNEKLIIDKPNITIKGRDNSVISYEDSCYLYKQRTKVDVKVGATTASAIIRVLPSANYFTIENVTIINTYKRRDLPNGQAVAFKSESHYTTIKNCKIISEQDTLYMDQGSNGKVIDSYIEGDIDFIFGSADCEFINCNIHAVNVNGYAYFTAPSTIIINDNGYIFRNCNFTADNGLEVYLGRPWFPGGTHQPIYPKMTFLDCHFQDDIKLELVPMTKSLENHYEFELVNCSYKNKIINFIVKM